ncbi:MAG TPA: heparan-alpha-glucosaminide N-acetyltransferase domain-containing protein [Edaphobacter sp.]|nr:heparan-alpha-glucosaminide N-acetyltransferase domain-containing protein [Edaphobacter sp.]
MMAVRTSPQVLSQENTTKTSQRLVFLDVLRGVTIAFMILVNNNGSEQLAYWPLKHSDWNGCTPTDLVFPTFLFVVGITIVLSTASRIARGESRSSLFRHALQRSAILFALGVLIHGFPRYPLETLRIYGVLQRIALCYLVTIAIYLWDRRVTTLVSVSIVCLLGYWILMRWVPIPGFGMPGRDFAFLDKDINWVSVVDRQLFPGRLLEKTRDPLGLISTIPAVATCLFGVLTGIWLRTARGMREKAYGLLVGAITGLVFGGLWGISFPINKRLWTSSYVVFAAGWTLLILFLCYFVIEIKKHQGRWTYPWKVFGSNAIFAYAFAELLSIVLEVIHIGDHAVSLKELIYTRFFAPIVDPSFGSLLYSLSYVLVCFVPCLVLFKRRIFIKI